MTVCFTQEAWDDYHYWQQADAKLVRRINQLIKEVGPDSFHGIGKPEPLTNQLLGWWSRRIDSKHRLVYKAEGNSIFIAQCRYHY